jgi:alkylation response protein AidB-like acyl-CoA dehydrogenase
VDLRTSPADEKFRRELKSWLRDAVRDQGPPPDREDWPARRVFDCAWQRRLFDGGYAGMSWPRAYGGRDASLSEQLIYHEEYAHARAPYVGVNFVGLLHGGPTIIAEGTPEQKARHIPFILRGEQTWCQGFSEPTAGSDLASLKTRAERVGDHYVVNGHKIWTSFAQVADYCELLVRTDPGAPKHKGISWLVMPMNLPGIEIRPLPELHGSTEFSEVFLSDVKVPVDHRVGAENDGWRVTNVTLRFERGTAMTGELMEMRSWLTELAEVARRVTRHDASAWDDRALRREVGELMAQLDAMWAMIRLSVAQAESTGVPGLGGSAVKLLSTEVKNRIGALAMRVFGRAGLVRSDVAGLPVEYSSWEMIQALSMTIAAGTSQIQRNIISERIQGLPKDR